MEDRDNEEDKKMILKEKEESQSYLLNVNEVGIISAFYQNQFDFFFLNVVTQILLGYSMKNYECKTQFVYICIRVCTAAVVGCPCWRTTC